MLPNPQHTYILMSFMAISVIEFHARDTKVGGFFAKSEQIQGKILSYVEMLNGKTF